MTKHLRVLRDVLCIVLPIMLPIALPAYMALYVYRTVYMYRALSRGMCIALCVSHCTCASPTGGRLNSLTVNAGLGGETEAGRCIGGIWAEPYETQFSDSKCWLGRLGRSRTD